MGTAIFVIVCLIAVPIALIHLAKEEEAERKRLERLERQKRHDDAIEWLDRATRD